MVKILAKPRDKGEGKQIAMAMGYGRGVLTKVLEAAHRLNEEGTDEEKLYFILSYAPGTLVGGYINHGTGSRGSGTNASTMPKINEIADWVTAFVTQYNAAYGEFKNADDNKQSLAKPRYY